MKTTTKEVLKKGCYIWCNPCQNWINKNYIKPKKHHCNTIN